MPASNQPKPNYKTLWTITLGAILIWSMILTGMLLTVIAAENRRVFDLARKEARTHCDKDLALQNWIAGRGGIYVDMDSGIRPSPYLMHIPEHVVDTTSGMRLTLMGPTDLLRQVMTEFSNHDGIKSRLINLQPLNPLNLADEWETRVLNRMRNGVKEIAEIASIDDEPFLRYMQAIATREVCLKCHSSDLFQVGRVDGAVSVLVPVKGFMEIKDNRVNSLQSSYGAIWFLGLFSIGIGNLYSRQQIRKKWRVDLALLEQGRQLEQERLLFITGPTVVLKWRPDKGWPIEYVSPNIKELLGYTKKELEAGDRLFTDLIHPDDLMSIKQEISDSTDPLYDSFEKEIRLLHQDGRYRWFYDLTNIMRDERGGITCFHGYLLDISERKQTLERLAKSESKYRSVINNTQEGFWFIDQNRKTVEVNDSLCALLGYPRDEILGRTPMEFTDERDHQIFWERTACIPLSEHQTYDISLRHKNGTRIPTHFTTTTLFGSDGQMIGTFAFVADQTRQKAVENTLRETKDRLAFALDGAQEGLWDWKVQTGEVYFSPRMEIMLGYAAGEWIPHISSWQKLVHPGDLDQVMDRLHEHLVGHREYFQVEYRMRHRDGRWIWIMSSGRVVARDTSGLPIRAVGTHIDISNRKEMEQALARSQAGLAEAQRIAKIGNWEFDLVKNALIWSDEVYRIFEIDKKDFDGTYADFLKFIHPDDTEKVNLAYQESLKTRMPYDITHRLMMQDGRIKYVHEICETQYDQSGKPLLSHGTVQDITEHHQANLELIAAKERAEAATREKSDFLATMSHEIRTPMNGVIGMAELLADSDLDGGQRDNVEIIRKSGKMLLDIVNNILDFSKLDARQVELEAISFNLETLCYNAMELVAPKANEKGLELVLDFQPDCPRMFLGDPGRLRQILLNLLGNALKFTEEGFVRLIIRGGHRIADRVRLSLSVEDSGIGIERNKQCRLFEAFTQADQATTRKFGGTGLGLSISRKLVQLMGGEISMDSEPGRGSVFRVELELREVKSDLPFDEMEMQGLRLLFLDQSKETANALLPLFAYLGIESLILHDKVRVIPELKSAVKRGQPFQIVFLDQPRYASDGVVLGQAIRNLPELSGVRLVVLTGLGHRGDAAYFRNSGFDAYLNKPLLGTTIVKVIRSLLELNGSERGIITRYTVDNETESRIETHRFNGRVLLVEDVPANQKVAGTMLRKLGVEVDIAENGLHAIVQWKHSHYDLIFMDCRMPEMDGYQASRTIRQQERGKQVPIVALTANATARDRQLCRRAGMNDIITKPFTKADLANALKRWIGDAVISDRNVQFDHKFDKALAREPIDFAVLERLRLDMGEEFGLVLEAIQQNISEILERLDSEIRSGNTRELSRLVHSLKSPSGNLGATHLYEMATAFERVIDQGNPVDASEHLTAIKIEYQRIHKALREKDM